MEDKILVVCSQHGNEKLGPLFKEFMKEQHPNLFSSLSFITGNPRAEKLNVRYIESDLNRSYGKDNLVTYEERRARYIAAFIQRTDPLLVIDMHTTTCKQPNILIVAGTDDPTVAKYLRASHLEHVLQVEPMNDITTVSPRFVAYEVPNEALNDTLFESICDDIRRFYAGGIGAIPKQIFRMTGKILKTEVEDSYIEPFVNFSYHPLGYYPILTGENSYKAQTDYLGFKAKRLEGFEI